ncbi:hypothetical protein [Rhodopirellula baltica]|uniref:Uncharacterized protein n=1 Tax=Rhodopirellula baltica WH47 TaxID=991778 RepID=F2ALS3_RHOBT|nr:hypothetical protein [Rhodopirellula baltica]EGF29381.1 hypothetical protein RBWH47_00252 [Rhodopirellula baltica WH47]
MFRQQSIQSHFDTTVRMKLLSIVLLSPILIPFLVVRYALRLGARIVTPFELVFLLFGFAVAWCIYRAWIIVHPDEFTPNEWKLWGLHMTEAGFDTFAAFLLAWFYFKLVLHRDLGADLDKLGGDLGAAGWIPFWLIALIPFAVRLRFDIQDGTYW